MAIDWYILLFHRKLTLLHFLGCLHVCRPLDPTLDIWSNFVKKEKEKKIVLALAGSSKIFIRQAVGWT